MKVEQLLKFMEEKSLNPICASCGKEEWSISALTDDQGDMMETRFLIQVFSESKEIKMKTMHLISFVCGNCGYVRFYAGDFMKKNISKEKE